MDLLVILILIAIAGICSAIAEYIVGFSPPGGILTSIVVGVVGAYLGNVVGDAIYKAVPIMVLAIQVGTITIDVFWSVLGSAIILIVLSVLRGSRRPGILDRLDRR